MANRLQVDHQAFVGLSGFVHAAENDTVAETGRRDAYGQALPPEACLYYQEGLPGQASVDRRNRDSIRESSH